MESNSASEIFIKISSTLTNKKMARTALSLSEKYKPTRANELQRVYELFNKLYFQNYIAETLDILNLLLKEEFTGNRNLWTWIQPALLLKCWISEDENETEKIVQKINDTFDFGTNELVKKVNRNVKERKLKGEHLYYSEIEDAQQSGDIQKELQYRIIQFYGLLFIYFLGGSNEFTKKRALKESKENEDRIKEIM